MMNMIQALTATRFDDSLVCRPLTWRGMKSNYLRAIKWKFSEWITVPATGGRYLSASMPTIEEILVPWEVVSEKDFIQEFMTSRECERSKADEPR